MGGGTGTVGIGLTLKDSFKLLYEDLIALVTFEEKRIKSLEAYLDEDKSVTLKDKCGRIKHYKTVLGESSNGIMSKIYVSPRKGIAYPFVKCGEGLYKYQGFISGAGGSN